MRFPTAIALLITSSAAVAANPGSDDAARAPLARALGVAIDALSESPLIGILEVQRDHDIAYVSANGRFLLRGELIDLETGDDLTELRRRSDRLHAVDGIGISNMIVFLATGGRAKSVVTIFTDVDCGYCRKLHSQLRTYTDLGITVRYLAWPRSGPHSPSFARAEAVWCAKDRAAALTHAMLGDDTAPLPCANPVAREYQLGVDLGVRGTPTMILPNGEMQPGYLPPAPLAERLAALSAPSAEAKAQ